QRPSRAAGRGCDGARGVLLRGRRAVPARDTRSPGAVPRQSDEGVRRPRASEPILALPPHAQARHRAAGRAVEAVRLGAACALAVTALAASASAEDPRAAAQAAFVEGRRLADAGDFAAAATRFEESDRLDPALGTTLNLAACYERAGRLASAARAFRRGVEEA